MALEKLPVPFVAVADDGTVVFANTAFADTLGCSHDAFTSMGYDDVIKALSPDETLVAVARLHAHTVEELRHLGGVTVYAKIGKWVVTPGAHSSVLATFGELAERLWPDGALWFRTGDAVN